jgi:hypothetical protein
MNIPTGSAPTPPPARQRPLNIERIFLVSAILSMLLTYTLQTVLVLSDPVKSTASDYISFYTAGVITRTHGIAHIYDVTLQRQVQQTLFDFQLGEKQVLLYNHLPYIVPLLPSFLAAPLGWAGYNSSFVLWMFFLTAVMLASIAILTGLIPALGSGDRRAIAAGALVFMPVYACIVNGQDSAFMLLGAALFTWGMLSESPRSRRRKILAGLALSLLTLRPHLAVFILIPLFFWSRKALSGYLAGSAALAVISLAMVGWQGALDYIHLLQISASGDWFGMSETSMFNLLGLLLRLFPGLPLNAAHLFAWGLFGLSGLAVAILFVRSEKKPAVKFALALLVVLLTSPRLHYHDLSLLLIPAFILLREMRLNGTPALKTLRLLPAAVSLLVFLSNAALFLQYASAYLLVAALAVSLARLPDEAPIGQSAPLSTPL